MADFPSRPDFFPLWGVVQAALNDPEVRARPGGVQQAIWQAYHENISQLPGEHPMLTIFQVNKLVSAAANIRGARGQLAGALARSASTGFPEALTGRMMAPDIDRGPGVGFTRSELMRARFTVNAVVGGIPSTMYLTYEPGTAPPEDTAALLADLEDVARSKAEEYGWEFAGLGDLVEITTY